MNRSIIFRLLCWSYFCGYVVAFHSTPTVKLYVSIVNHGFLRPPPLHDHASCRLYQYKGAIPSINEHSNEPKTLSRDSIQKQCRRMTGRLSWRSFKIMVPFLVHLSKQIILWMRRHGWVLPMNLAIIPAYTAIFQGKHASMPHWWQVVNMANLHHSSPSHAAMVIGGFLFSNIAYFLSGFYLLRRFPFEPLTDIETSSPENNMNIKARRKPTEFSMLGIWIILAGFVSTLFHSAQALGPHALSESLCFVDHAFAISAAFYFLKTCGFPSTKVLSVGLSSLATLIWSHPAYVTIHSLWHFLSASTATLWAIDGHKKRAVLSSS